MSIANNNHQQVGDLGETMFQEKYRDAKSTTHNHPFDFMLKGKRVEIKASNFRSTGYQANLREHTADDFDIVVMILLSDDPPIWLVIPMSELLVKKITIRDRNVNGKYSRYINNFEILN